MALRSTRKRRGGFGTELINIPQVHLEESEKIESSETSFVQCFWQLEQTASAVIKEVEQRKCKSTCETGEIGKPVVEDGG